MAGGDHLKTIGAAAGAVKSERDVGQPLGSNDAVITARCIIGR